jgi:hypothetical protein
MFLSILTLTLFTLFNKSYADNELSKISFGLPVECEYGKECVIRKYVDHGLGDLMQDYNCGRLTSDTHKGTDFAVIGDKKNVAVLAAAAGVVTNYREGMEDLSYKFINKNNVKSKECGNAVIINHGGGYSTQYCHLKRYSVKVQKGDKVTKGQKIGEIGMSGMSEFRHLHLTIYKDKKHIDPFVPNGQKKCGAADMAVSLWDKNLHHKFVKDDQRKPILIDASFSANIPDSVSARSGYFQDKIIYSDTESILFWADVMSLKKNDILRLELLNSNGEVLAEHNKIMDKNFGSQFMYIGKKISKELAAGRYQGVVSVLRGSNKLLNHSVNIQVVDKVVRYN